MISIENLPRFIYITGCDGTGKSTQARLLVEYLRSHAIKVNHLWLRFPFFFCLPFLAYARFNGLSWGAEKDGYKHGYWEFWRSPIMRYVFPWALLLDATLAACWNIYLPLLMGTTIVCERFSLDMLSDLIIACQDETLPFHFPGRLYPVLIPKLYRLIILEMDYSRIVERRPDLINDKMLDARLRTFQLLARIMNCPVISSNMPIDFVHQEILKLIGV